MSYKHIFEQQPVRTTLKWNEQGISFNGTCHICDMPNICHIFESPKGYRLKSEHPTCDDLRT